MDAVLVAIVLLWANVNNWVVEEQSSDWWTAVFESPSPPLCMPLEIILAVPSSTLVAFHSILVSWAFPTMPEKPFMERMMLFYICLANFGCPWDMSVDSCP